MVKKILKTWGASLACGLFSVFLFRSVLLLGYVPSASMEPTIPAGSYILGLRIYDAPKRGEIVIFRFDGKILVKRVAATPGDPVYLDETHIQSNGQELTNLIVPDGCYYLLGDNPTDSYDARYWPDPFIRKENILAKLILP